MNITLFGIDDTAVINFASQLSKKLNITHINATSAFSDYLMSKDKKSNKNLEKLEKSFIEEISNFNNVIISIPHDIFISNKNYKLLKKSLKIHVKFNLNNEILENLDNLLEKYADINISNVNFLNEVVKILKEKYNI